MNTNSSLFKEMNEKELKALLFAALSRNDGFKYSLMDGGLFNTTYLIEYENGEKFVLRLGPVNRHLILEFEEHMMEAEDYAYKLCKENNLPCSDVVFCDTSKTLVDRDVMIVRYIKSVPLSSAEEYTEEKSAVYREVGEYSKKLHQIKSDCFGRLSYIVSGKKFSGWYDYIIYEANSILTKGVEFGAWDGDFKNTVLSLYKKQKPLLDTVKEAVLVHADLWEGNVLINDGKLAAVIDHDRAIFGDVDFEFACPWMTNADFYKGYGEREFSPCFELKQRLYLLLLCLSDTYVLHSEYNNPEGYRESLIKTNEIIEELKKEN